ncbi:MAG: PIG-L family deacetylase [archaeon]
MPIRSDDEAIGMGGTIAKYVKERKKVIKVVFSHGEKSIPHYQEQFVKRTRNKETKEASAFIGIKETINLGLADSKLKKEVKNPKIREKILEILKKYKPEKIYVPSALDIHPDHQAVHKKVLNVVDEQLVNYQVYAYEVWNIMNENHPMIYIDISNYINQKMDYIKIFKSQWMYMFTLYLPAYLRAKKYGRKIKVKFAEKFYRLR